MLGSPRDGTKDFHTQTIGEKEKSRADIPWKDDDKV